MLRERGGETERERGRERERRENGEREEEEDTPNCDGGSLPVTVAHRDREMQSKKLTHTPNTPIVASSVASSTLSVSPGNLFQPDIAFTAHCTRLGTRWDLSMRCTNMNCYINKPSVVVISGFFRCSTIVPCSTQTQVLIESSEC